jgi:hypothetical protein
MNVALLQKVEVLQAPPSIFCTKMPLKRLSGCALLLILRDFRHEPAGTAAHNKAQ